MLGFLFFFIGEPFMISIFRGISSDPSTPKLWKNLYDSVYFRFLFIFIVVYQNSKNKIDALVTTVVSMLFFYIISNKKEKERYNFKIQKKQFNTFMKFIIFVVGLYYLKQKIITQEIRDEFNIFELF